MKVIKCSDETYAFVCQVAADRKTYLADAVDFLVFKQSQKITELESRVQELEAEVERLKLPRVVAKIEPKKS